MRTQRVTADQAVNSPEVAGGISAFLATSLRRQAVDLCAGACTAVEFESLLNNEGLVWDRAVGETLSSLLPLLHRGIAIAGLSADGLWIIGRLKGATATLWTTDAGAQAVPVYDLPDPQQASRLWRVSGDSSRYVRRRAAPHERTLQEFCNFARRVAESNYRAFELEAIQTTLFITRMVAPSELPEVECSDRRYRVFRCANLVGVGVTSQMFITHRLDTSRALGGIVAGTPVVLPEHRGQGLGVALVASALRDQPFYYLNPVSLSEGGYAVRRRIHANECREAIAAGLSISERVRKSNDLLQDLEGHAQISQAPAPVPVAGPSSQLF